ncbi:MAG: hypothetical protein QXN53_05285 [Thermoproteota archaeon]
MSKIESKEQQSRESLQKWIENLIFRFRAEMEKLTPEERMAASQTLNDLSEPCQFMIIWAKEPEFQIVIISRLTQIEDKHVKIYGPIENSRLIEHIENEVLKSPIVKLIGNEKVEDALIQELRWIQSLYNPIYPQKPGVDGQMSILSDVYAASWLIIGNLLNLDVQELVNKFIQNIKLAAKPSPPPSLPPSPILEGFGTYIYPPIWIGEMPKPKSFGEKITGRHLLTYPIEKVITDTYKNRPIIITRDGYIAIGEKDRLKAQELINEIVSTLLLRGLHVQVIREIDLGEARFTESESSFTWNPFSLRMLSLHAERFLLSISRTPISEEKLRKTLKIAEILTADDRIKTLLLLYLEAFTYFTNTEYKQTLMIGWIILEDFYIKDLWASQISKVTSDKNRTSKLWSWNVDQRLEALNLSNEISNDEYNLLMKIKDARNEVVHEGKFPEKEIVEKCIELASKVVQRYVGDHLGKRITEL